MRFCLIFGCFYGMILLLIALDDVVESRILILNAQY